MNAVAAILDLVADGAGSTLLSRRAVETSAHRASFMLRKIDNPPLHSRLSIATSSRRPATLTQKAILDVLHRTARALLDGAA